MAEIGEEVTSQLAQDFVGETAPQPISGVRPVRTAEGIDQTSTALLAIFSYVIGAMLFAPLIPSFLVLVLYVLVIEVIVYIAYRVMGWSWNPLLRILTVCAILVGYLVGQLFYLATTAVLRN